MKSITIPNSVTVIGGHAFQNISSLEEVIFPNKDITIGDYVFAYCSSLKKITIPEKITAIGNSMFKYCSSLTELHVQATTPPQLGTEAFNYVANNFTIYVPQNSKSLYEAADGWKEFTIVGE